MVAASHPCCLGDTLMTLMVLLCVAGSGPTSSTQLCFIEILPLEASQHLALKTASQVIDSVNSRRFISFLSASRITEGLYWKELSAMDLRCAGRTRARFTLKKICRPLRHGSSVIGQSNVHFFLACQKCVLLGCFENILNNAAGPHRQNEIFWGQCLLSRQ